MSTKSVLYGQEAREKLNIGVQKLTKAVASTLGANGANVMIASNLGKPRITKDGVSIAKEFRLYDFVENAGADTVKEAAISAAEISGDGTTTATVLAGVMINEGIKRIEDSKRFSVREGMNKAVNFVVNELDNNKQKGDLDYNSLLNVATISANGNKEIGETIANVVHKFGKTGKFSLSRENHSKTFIDERAGYTYEKGMVSPHLTQIEGEVFSSIDNPRLLIIDDNMNDLKRYISPINHCIENNIPLVIMANHVGNECLRQILINMTKGHLSSKKFCLIETPNFNERRTQSLRDIARCTKSRIFSLDDKTTVGITDFNESDLGYLHKFISDESRTTLVFTEEGEKEANLIISELKNNISKTDKLKEDITNERIDRLSSGSATVFFHAKTDVEHSELYDLYEDALKACESALEQGVIVGGGLALLKASSKLSRELVANDDEFVGLSIVKKACEAPFEHIVRSSGVNYEEVLKQVIESDYNLGYDARNNKVTDLLELGVIDPVKVTKVSLQSALSASVIILTTDTVIYPYDFENLTTI